MSRKQLILEEDKSQIKLEMKAESDAYSVFSKGLKFGLERYKKSNPRNFDNFASKEGLLTCMDYFYKEGQEVFHVLGSDHGTVWKYEPNTNNLIKLLESNKQERINCLKISSSGKFVVVAYDGSIKKIGLNKEGLLGSIDNPDSNSRFTAVALVRGDSEILTGSSNQVLEIFDIALTAPSKPILLPPTGKQKVPIRSIIPTEDGEYVMLGWGSSSIIIFDVIKRTILHEVKHPHDDPVTALAMSIDGQFFVSGAQDGSLAIFNIDEEKYVDKFEGVHDNVVTSIALTQDNNFVVSTSDDNTIRVFDLQRKFLIHIYEKSHQGKMIAVAVNHNNRSIIAISQSDFWVQDITSQTDSEDTVTLNTEEKISEVVISNLNRWIAVGSTEGKVSIYEKNRKLVKSIDFGENGEKNRIKICSIAFSKKDNQIVIASEHGVVKVFDTGSDSQFPLFEKAFKSKVFLKCSKRNGRVYWASDESLSYLELGELISLKAAKNESEKPITGLAVFNKCVVITTDRFIKVFKTDLTFKCNTLTLYEGNPSCVTMSKDEKYIICGTERGNLHIFNIITGEPPFIIQAHGSNSTTDQQHK